MQKWPQSPAIPVIPMQIVEYAHKMWSIAVTGLLSAIYPDWLPVQWERLSYDENLPLHLVTLLAVHGETPVGQINVFCICENAALGNVGYHVHPDWQGNGIGSLLLCTAWPTIVNVFEDGLVIQTTLSNTASKAHAAKAGFLAVRPGLVENYGTGLQFRRNVAGVCFHHPRTRQLPTVELRQSAERAAALL
jgi:GNAT superfamily N-acetyltransferase